MSVRNWMGRGPPAPPPSLRRRGDDGEEGERDLSSRAGRSGKLVMSSDWKVRVLSFGEAERSRWSEPKASETSKARLRSGSGDLSPNLEQELDKDRVETSRLEA